MICYLIIAAVYLLHYGYVESGTNPLTIAGGNDITNITTHKYMASIHVQGYRCGGSIITHALVITAAHCTHQIAEKLISVHVGSLHPVEGGEYKNISEKFEHSFYNNKTNENDICILLLKDSLTYDDDKGAIKLLNRGVMPFNYGLSDGTLIKALGFGKMQDESYAQTLQEVDLRMVDYRLCQSAYNIAMDLKICASGLNKKLKNGDDGSPVLYENRLIGIVSFTEDYHETGVSILVDLSRYLNFILFVMNTYP